MVVKTRKELKDLPFITKGSIIAENDASLVAQYIPIGLREINETNRSGRLWASDAAHCSRRGALNATYVGETIDSASKKAYCELGNTIEDLVIGALEKQDLVLFKQYQLPNIDLNLGGFVDALIATKIKGEQRKIRVLEIKSCGELPSKPKPEHLSQTRLYGAVLGLPITLLYFSRNVANYEGVLQTREFNFDFNVDDVRQYVFSACYTKFAVDMNVLPAIPSQFTSPSHCGLCDYKSTCWNGGAFHLRPIEAREHLELVNKANSFTNDFLDAQRIRQRRNGVFKHLMKSGSQVAKEILSGKDWDALI